MTAAATNETATNGAAYDAHTATNANANANGNGHGHHSFDNEKAHQAPNYTGGSAGGNHLSRTLTPGGHFADDDLIAIANTHRRIANPLPLGGKFFGLSLFSRVAVQRDVPGVLTKSSSLVLFFWVCDQ